MPNWCENTLIVSGNKKEIGAFRKKAKSKKTDLSLAKLYPEPDYNKVKVKPTFVGFKKKLKYVDPKEAWWDWRIQNWGTKWDIEATLDIDDDTYLEYVFDSAWSPPVEWLKEVSKKFKGLTFVLKYDESSNCFRGVAKAVKGKLFWDKCIEY